MHWRRCYKSKRCAMSAQYPLLWPDLTFEESEPLEQDLVALRPDDIDRNRLSRPGSFSDRPYRPVPVRDVGIPNLFRPLAFCGWRIGQLNDVAVGHVTSVFSGLAMCLDQRRWFLR